MKLLMHTCCAPCSVYCVKSLRNKGIEPVSYWFNPNIHPYIEYKTRRDTLMQYSKIAGFNLIIEENYGLKEFCKETINDLNNRCSNYCYRVRLEQTAKYAKEQGYDAFTTTLLISPYQKHEELRKIGKEIGEKYNIEFLYRDFRVGFKEGQEEARNLGLYMQKYCGCIFSSEEKADYDSRNFADTQKSQNKITEKNIRLGWDVPSLELKQYKNGNQEQIKFIYDLKKDVYQVYVKKYYGEWNEEIQKKIFERFMKENSRNIELIFFKGKLVGFYNGKEVENECYEIGNICIKTEYQNKGIGTAILKEILFESKGKEIKLQVFKTNENAIKLYEKMGFENIDETKTHYIMKKVLKE